MAFLRVERPRIAPANLFVVGLENVFARTQRTQGGPGRHFEWCPAGQFLIRLRPNSHMHPTGRSGCDLPFGRSAPGAPCGT